MVLGTFKFCQCGHFCIFQYGHFSGTFSDTLQNPGHSTDTSMLSVITFLRPNQKVSFPENQFYPEMIISKVQSKELFYLLIFWPFLLPNFLASSTSYPISQKNVLASPSPISQHKYQFLISRPGSEFPGKWYGAPPQSSERTPQYQVKTPNVQYQSQYFDQCPTNPNIKA